MQQTARGNDISQVLHQCTCASIQTIKKPNQSKSRSRHVQRLRKSKRKKALEDDAQYSNQRSLNLQMRFWLSTCYLRFNREGFSSIWAPSFRIHEFETKAQSEIWKLITSGNVQGIQTLFSEGKAMPNDLIMWSLWTGVTETLLQVKLQRIET